MDIGNFASDPYKSMEAVMPKVLTIHAKTEVHTEDGTGTEPADYPRVMRILRDANYRGYISLEYEGKEDAMQGVPKYLSKLRSAIVESWPGLKRP
jgi:sugar phosphate isomerase/epimerase